MDPTEAGLMPDHSYTILDGKESAQLNVKLLEIRNPWGHGEWKGDWSDDSDKWTPLAKKEFGITEELDPDDGAFWMAWPDFLKYFTTLTVCYCRRDWSDARCGITLNYDFDNKLLTTNPIKLTVPKGGTVEWIGMFQTDLRERGAPPYIDITAMIFRETNNGRQPVGYIGAESARQVFQSFSDESRNDLMKEPLQSGTYLIVPFTSGRHWDESTPNQRDIAFSCHAVGLGNNNKNGLVMQVCNETYSKTEFDQCFLDMAMVLGEEKKWHDLERRHLRI
eukprot:293815_1